MHKHSALVIIDMQVGLLASAYQPEEVLANINTLLGKARSTRTPVIYIKHDEPPGYGLAVGSADWQIHPAILPIDGETVVHKRASDAFYDTSLQQELTSRGIKELIVVGGQTEYCVDTTVRRATTCGYNVTLVGDAHTTEDSPPWTAAQIIAYHNSILDHFHSDAYTILVKATDEIAF